MLSEYTATLIMHGPCVNLRRLNVWNGCLGQTVRTFVDIAACAIDLTRNWYRCSMQYGTVCAVTSFMRHFAVRIHHNFYHNGLALIFVGAMYGTVPRWPCTNSSYVSSYCCMCDYPYSKLSLVFDAVWSRMCFYLIHATFCFASTLHR